MSKLDELINELCPDGVEYKYFFDICEYIRGITYNKNDEINDNSEGIKVLRANNITLESNSLNYSDIKTVSKDVKIKDNQWLKKNDILICAGSGSKEHIGKVAYIVEDLNMSFGGFMGVIRSKTDYIIPGYLFHFFTSQMFKMHLSKVSSSMSSTINNINNETFKNLSIPVPPLPVQQEIVRILDKFTELETELETELVLRKKQYEYYSSKLFSETDSKDIELGSIANFVYGYTDTAKDIGDVRYIRITDITEQGCLKKGDEKYIYLSNEAKKSILKKGDLIMARTGATYGKTLYFDSDVQSVYASFLIKIIPDNNILLNKYYWHFTKTPLYWEQAKRLVTIGGQPQFNTPAVKQIKIPVPSLEKQKQIVDILDRFEALCNDLTSGLPAEIEARRKQYEYYRDKLLTFKKINSVSQ